MNNYYINKSFENAQKSFKKLIEYILLKIKIFSIGAGLFTCIYFVARTIILAYTEYSNIDRGFGIFLLIGETYILIHSFGYMLNVFKIVTSSVEFPKNTYNEKTAPPVVIITAARHEPKYILRETIITFKNIDYHNKHIYFLDDSSDEKFIDEADKLAKEFDINIYRRKERHGAKAGIVNDFLKTRCEKYIAIFDADQNPMPNFLNNVIPIMESDEKLAFVQTPQLYTNITTSPISRGATIQQAIFYESICEGKSINNATFCCGTNVVFRINALKDVGGFDETSITEDFATSIKLHMKGYKSKYYNHVCAFGMAPESLASYFKQQTRWATGTISMFTRMIKLFFKNPTKLSPLQWWEYFLAGTYYFIGWAFFIMMVCPIAYLLFGIPSFFLSPIIYILTFLPYFLLSMLIFYSTMEERHYSPSDIYHGTILGQLSFPILMRSAIYGVINKKVPFVITTKGVSEIMPIKYLLPWIIMIIFNISAIYCGTIKLLNTFSWAVSINSFWATYHIFILSNIFYFNGNTKKEIFKISLASLFIGIFLGYIFCNLGTT